MAVIEETVDVKVPLHVAYDQWTQFEDFPRFMEGVEQVEQLTETTLEWRARIAGVEKRWRTRIVEQVPDQRITWVSVEGARTNSTVSFSSLGGDTTRVSLLIDVEPEGPVANIGAALGLVRGRSRGDLERFSDFIQGRGPERGAGPGEIIQSTPRHDAGALTDATTVTRAGRPGRPGLPDTTDFTRREGVQSIDS